MPMSPLTAERQQFRTPHRSGGESRTHQAFKEQTDLPARIRQWTRQGVLREALEQPPLNYGDFSNVDDYLSALLAVREAERAFLTLPAKVRRRFGNDPQELLSALDASASNDQLRDELVDLGVINAPEAPSPAPAAPEAPAEPAEPSPPEGS